jgi:uncharacterized protein YdhG (YjbR/CyaY superfamily)
MSKAEIDAYLEPVPQPHRSALEALRTQLTALLPDAQEVITYGVPTFKVGGKGVAGFGMYKNHCTYFPMSGSITAELSEDLTEYATAKGSIRFAPDAPLPDALVAKLVDARLREIARTKK